MKRHSLENVTYLKQLKQPPRVRYGAFGELCQCGFVGKILCQSLSRQYRVGGLVLKRQSTHKIGGFKILNFSV